MKFTKKNLLDALRDINPEKFDKFVEFTNFPNLMDLMFIEGFRRALVNEGDFRYVLQRPEQMNILLEAYNQMYHPGYLTFEVEE